MLAFVRTRTPVFVLIASLSAGCGLFDQGQGANNAPQSTQPNGTQASPAPSAATQDQNSAPGTTWQTMYTYRGRFDFADPQGPRFAWPGSAIGATFEGTTLGVKLAEPMKVLYSGTPVNNTYDVVVDNAAPVVVQAQQSTATYPVASGLAAGTHHVWITKRTEANVGPGQFLGFDLQAGKLLAPPAPAARVLEFVGDSASSGYGADGNYPAWNGCTFSVATADAAIAYPVLAAQALGADAVNLAFAGKGITRNLADSDVNTMPKIYDYVEPMTLAWAYDFKSYVPDVVVLNIGGNDWVGESGSGTPPDEDTFVSDYVQLLQTIHTHAPKAAIFITLTAMAYGTDRTTLAQYLQDVQAEASKSMQNVFYFEFPEYDGDLGWGCDGHPDAAAHAQMANQIASEIRAHMSW